MKEEIIDGLKCVIGSNASENWLIFSNAKPHHIFFHLASFPSCYVILETDEEYPNIETIEKAALICKKNTKYRNVPNLKIDYTVCKNITKGCKIGEVIYKSNRQVKQIKL